MGLYRCIVLLFITSFFVYFVLASPAVMVLEGAMRKAALQDAIRMCPEFINKNRKKEIARGIQKLLAPAYVASDPNRRTYQIDYIPTEEERIAKAVELCAGHGQIPYAETQAAKNLEGVSQIEEEGQEDRLNLDAQDIESFQRTQGLGKYFLFIFGAVCGMLVVFVYFHVKEMSPAQICTNKVLRRPEL